MTGGGLVELAGIEPATFRLRQFALKIRIPANSADCKGMRRTGVGQEWATCPPIRNPGATE